MKRFLYVISTLILFALLTACNADEKKIVIMEDLNNPSREEIRAKTQNEPKDSALLSEEVGLGATRKDFDAAYGENSGNLEIARYQGEFMIVTFEGHRAYNIQYQFANKPGNAMTEEEIYAYIQKRIPHDAVEINRKNENSERKVIDYRSESLRTVTPRHSYRGGEPGNFVVIINKDEDGNVTAIVSLGNSGNLK